MKIRYRKRSSTVQELMVFLDNVPPGATVLFEQIEQETGITMNQSGREKLRQALHSLERPYQPIHGKGIELLGVQNGLEIVHGKMNVVQKSIANAKRIHRLVDDQVGPALKPHERRSLGIVATALTAMELAGQEMRQKIKSNQGVPLLPGYNTPHVSQPQTVVVRGD